MLALRGLLSATAAEFVTTGQAQILSLPSIAAVWMLGWVGVLLGPRAGFAPLVGAGIPSRRRFLVPAVIGAAIGGCAVAIDLLQPLGAAIQIRFPASLFAYPLGGVIEEILFRLFLSTVLVWLASNVMLGGRRQTEVFRVVTVVVALIYTAAQLGAYQAVGTVTPLIALRFLVLIGIFFVVAAQLHRQYGFLAAVSARLGEYLVWHILWGS